MSISRWISFVNPAWHDNLKEEKKTSNDRDVDKSIRKYWIEKETNRGKGATWNKEREKLQ